MTETEYIRVSNKTATCLAMACLRDILPGNEYGVDEKKFRSVCRELSKIQDQLFKVCKTDGD